MGVPVLEHHWWGRMIVTGVGPGLARLEMLPDRFLSKLRGEE